MPNSAFWGAQLLRAVKVGTLVAEGDGMLVGTRTSILQRGEHLAMNLRTMKTLLIVTFTVIVGIAAMGAHKRRGPSPNFMVQGVQAHLSAGYCHSVDGLPDAACTPGVVRTT